MLDLSNEEHKEIYDKLDEKSRDLVVKRRNNFTFSDFSKNKKALKNRNDLDNSTFHSTHLDNANLSGSNLEKSFFSHSSLCDANLKKANLKEAIFEFGQADGTDFEGANLEGAKFTGVWGLERANFKDTIFEGKPGYGDKWTGKSKLAEFKEEEKIKRKQRKLESGSKKGGSKSKKSKSKKGKRVRGTRRK